MSATLLAMETYKKYMQLATTLSIRPPGAGHDV